MKPLRSIVIIGATSAIASHCARLWIQAGLAELVLVGRRQEGVERVAADLQVRAPDAKISCHTVDFHSPEAIQTLAERVCRNGLVDVALIAHGALPDQEACQVNVPTCRDALMVNGISPVMFAEAFATQMQLANRGTVAIIGSVAGDRGRKTNYVYGAAKGLVARYAQGLQHRLARSGVRVVLIKPGPTDTPMTAHLKSQGARMADVESVSRAIVEGIDKGSPVVYAPAKWRLIMLVIMHLPRVIFHRMEI